MKKTVSILLVLCLCLGLTACSSAGRADAAKPSAAPAAESAAPAPAQTAAPTPEPTPEVDALQTLVESLNTEEIAHRTKDDPSVGVFELGPEKNTIVYKFAMHIFQYVILRAQAGDQENLSAYNRLLDSLPSLEVSLENALRETQPDVRVLVYLMVDEYSRNVAAVIENGEIVYDMVNGVGTAPEGVMPVLETEELSPEMKEKIEDLKNAMSEEQANAGNG